MAGFDQEDRRTALDMTPDKFRAAGHALVDQIADLWSDPSALRVTSGDEPDKVWDELGKRGLPETGEDAGQVLKHTTDLLVRNSLFNGHPRFFGYITAGAAPIGVLSEMLAAAINPNCGGWPLSPMASAIEIQSVQWIAELIGYRKDCGGLLCSGGNMANLLSFWAARSMHTDREKGVGATRLRAYAAETTHTWIHKAGDLSGIGMENVVMVPCHADERMDVAALRKLIAADVARGSVPFIVVASGGTVSTGAVDDIAAIKEVCDEFGVWLHIDGAYGAFAACLPDAPEGLKQLHLADSIALDPHKWLYAPLEAGCVLVRERKLLLDAFSYRPPYYQFQREDSPDWCNFYELGVQNSRGFRALKVWTALRQAGRKGYVESIGQDVALAQAMADYAATLPEIEVKSCRLSIVTFRYRPDGLGAEALDALNRRIVEEVQKGGEAFVSNAVLDSGYYLRACIVNFRTQLSDVRATVDLALETGRRLARERDSSANESLRP